MSVNLISPWGEFYFEKEKWKNALNQYTEVVKKKKSRLNSFALYKSAWCYYRLQKYQKALSTLIRVIKVPSRGSRQKVAGTRTVDKLRLAKEAVKDFVSFYERTNRYKEAYDDFMEITNSERDTRNMIEQLAYRYSYSGRLKFFLLSFQTTYQSLSKKSKGIRVSISDCSGLWFNRSCKIL